MKANMQKTRAVRGKLSWAKNTYVTATTWVAPHALIKSAHLFKRMGLAAIGGSCGLYVGAALMRPGNELFGSGWIVLSMMLYGAFSFFVGIDLPGRPAHRSASRSSEERRAETDVAGIFSAAGTFVAAIAAVLSVTVIVFDQTVADGLILFVGCCWATGSALQIAAGALARDYSK
jgi:hypothetical protein